MSIDGPDEDFTPDDLLRPARRKSDDDYYAEHKAAEAAQRPAGGRSSTMGKTSLEDFLRETFTPEERAEIHREYVAAVRQGIFQEMLAEAEQLEAPSPNPTERAINCAKAAGLRDFVAKHSEES